MKWSVEMIEDCSVTIQIKNGNFGIHARQIDLVQMAALSGYFQTFIGIEAIKSGMEIEQVKTNLYDIYEEASQKLDWIKWKG